MRAAAARVRSCCTRTPPRPTAASTSPTWATLETRRVCCWRRSSRPAATSWWRRTTPATIPRHCPTIRSWSPQAPTLLCGGDEDPTVFWLNTELMQDYVTQHAPASTSLSVLDLDAAAAGADLYGSIRSQFETAKQAMAAAAVLQGATDGGAAAVADAYHSTQVPPFCLAAVISFFDAQ